jgi:hypothetical protein
VAEFLGRSSISFVDGELRKENGIGFFDSEFGSLQLPDDTTSRLENARLEKARVEKATQLTLGLRLDGVTVRRTSPPSGRAWLGEVEWLELREEGVTALIALQKDASGNRSEVPDLADRGQPTVVARVSPAEAVSVKDRVWIEIDWSRALWFDLQTGNNLAPAITTVR